jgi:hypothetical protein
MLSVIADVLYVRQKSKSPEPASRSHHRELPPTLMNEKQPIPPEPESMEPQTEPQVDKYQTNSEILSALAALQADSHQTHLTVCRILELIEEPALMAEQKRQQIAADSAARIQDMSDYARGVDAE